MPKTLLLCFIHGFKGDEETFFDFPLVSNPRFLVNSQVTNQRTQNLKEKVASQCPQIDVQTRVYPKYETRGDLAACVETFKEWLQEQVISIEVANGNKSAILEPNVGVILIAHSMGYASPISISSTRLQLTSSKWLRSRRHTLLSSRQSTCLSRSK
jgi:hypothetical protein